MYVLEICLFLIVLIAGISATITDLKNSIISNKMIVRMMGFSIPLSILYYGYFARDLIPLYLINLLCTTVFSFFFYSYNLWAAGDSKLLFVIMTAIPARAYYMNPLAAKILPNKLTKRMLISVILPTIKKYEYIKVRKRGNCTDH